MVEKAPLNSCPDKRQLQEWLESDAPLSESLVAHIGQCGRCCSVLEEMCDAKDLRGARPTQRTHEFLSEREFARVRERIKLIASIRK